MRFKEGDSVITTDWTMAQSRSSIENSYNMNGAIYAIPKNSIGTVVEGRYCTIKFKLVGAPVEIGSDGTLRKLTKLDKALK